MNEELKKLIEQYIKEQTTTYPLSPMENGVVFAQIEKSVWSKMIANAIVELVDEGKIRVVDGYLYLPVE